MLFYDNWILNPRLTPNWFTNVNAIEITPNPGISRAGPFPDQPEIKSPQVCSVANMNIIVRNAG